MSSILMTVDLNELFPVILYFFLIILVIVVTILVIRLIVVLKKVNNILDNVEDKVNKLNGLFDIVDNVSDGINIVSEKISTFVYDKISKLIDKKKGTDEDE